MRVGMENLDYALIRAILQELEEVYPNSLVPSHLRCAAGADEKKLVKLLYYLEEHGKITMPVHKYLGGGRTLGKLTITKNGIDFLQPDGGLSALTTSIRIAPESITAIIDAALAGREASETERDIIRKSLEEAGPEAVRTLVGRLIDAGIKYVPKLFDLLNS